MIKSKIYLPSPILQLIMYNIKLTMLYPLLCMHNILLPSVSGVLQTPSFADNVANQCSTNISIHGLILARNGSKGILHKNLAPVGGTSLVARAIKTMIAFKKFSSVWVSTDSHAIAAEAEKHGAQIHWRNEAAATDSASSLMALQEFINTHLGVDRIALVQCTSPFLHITYLDKAYKLLQQGFDSVFSATWEHKLRWEYNSDKSVKPLNFDPSNRPRRQDWQGEFVENGMFYFTRRKFIYAGLIQFGRIGIIEIPKYKALEIDTPQDLHVAQLLDAYFISEDNSSTL